MCGVPVPFIIIICLVKVNVLLNLILSNLILYKDFIDYKDKLIGNNNNG